MKAYIATIVGSISGFINYLIENEFAMALITAACVTIVSFTTHKVARAIDPHVQRVWKGIKRSGNESGNLDNSNSNPQP